LNYNKIELPYQWRDSSSSRFVVVDVETLVEKKIKIERNACFSVTLAFPDYERSE